MPSPEWCRMPMASSVHIRIEYVTPPFRRSGIGDDRGCFAIVRLASDDVAQSQVTVKEVVSTEAEAIAEVDRSTRLAAMTHVDRMLRVARS
jgi:hypothetical protein